jgi:tetratricopeptide (TPR) repeat protein
LAFVEFARNHGGLLMPSLQDLIRRRQQSEFIGRGDYIRAFRDNLALRSDDERRWHIFSVHGQGGVGKTALLTQFRKIAGEAGTVTAYVDEFDDDVLKAMAATAEQLTGAAGFKSSKFLDRYREYRQHRQELELDPEAPQGFPAFLGATLVKTGFTLGRRIPVAGAVFDLVDEESAAAQAGEWTAYVARKLSNRDEVELVREPVEVLSRLFVSEIRRMAERSPVLLMFDTYERTSEFLDPWIRALLDGSYGDLPLNLTLVIAGRDELERNYWAPYLGVLSRNALDPFTEPEARDYLTRKGLTNERTVSTILKLTGRLPLLLATLASESPDDPAQVGDPSGTAVERFLKWVQDPVQREAAVDTAFCRSFNLDVVEVLVGSESARAVFAWLQRMPFTVEKADAWYYHEVVRSSMLRHRKRQSPQGWARLHARLAQYHASRVEALGERGGQPEESEAASLERVYHHLCATGDLADAVNGFARALGNSNSFARRWAETVQQAGADSERKTVEDWGARMVTGLGARMEKQHAGFTELLTEVLEFVELDPSLKAQLHRVRGQSYRRAEAYLQAVPDLDQAVIHCPDDAETLFERGDALRMLGRYDESLRDLGQAILLRPEWPQPLANRAATRSALGRHEEALSDLDESLRLDPSYAWGRTQRGVVLRRLKRYDESLSELDHALRLNPGYAYCHAQKGATLRAMGRAREAVRALTRAIKLDPGIPWYYTERGEAFRSLHRFPRAVAEFDKALELDPLLARAYSARARVNREVTTHAVVLADLDRAVELAPADEWIRYLRARYLRMLGRLDDAMLDLQAAEEANPLYVDTYDMRGQVWFNRGDFGRAIEEFSHALEINASIKVSLARRGVARLMAGDPVAGLADCNAAADTSSNSWVRYLRGVALRATGRADQAVDDFREAMRLANDPTDPEAGSARVNRCLYHLALREYDEARRLYAQVAATPLTLVVAEATRDLEDFLLVFPGETAAVDALRLLESALETI